MAGSSWGRVNNAAAAFQGGSYASITAGTAGTQWLQGGPSLFPAAGKLVTQVAIYLDPSTGWSINGQAFSYSVALNNIASFGTGVFRDYIFSIGWYDAATSALGSKAFWVAASDFTVSDPKNFPSGSNRNSIPITQPGWYYLQHAFVPKTCPPNIGYGSTAKCIYAQMKVFKASVGASCGSVVATQSGSATASWEVGPRGKGFSGTPSDQVEDIAGPRYGYFNMPATSSLSVDYFYYVAFSS
uniref:Uncharacterized protein n=1 Tax=Tetradesmus obliquus TaxID=3088 RepID=A0A383WP97_TETOB|eukprot:jgi/Sobl393_1/4660/SZX79287.1